MKSAMKAQEDGSVTNDFELIKASKESSLLSECTCSTVQILVIKTFALKN